MAPKIGVSILVLFCAPQCHNFICTYICSNNIVCEIAAFLHLNEFVGVRINFMS